MTTDRELDLGRRRTLAASGAMMAGILAASTPEIALANQPPSGGNAGLPVEQIEKILRTDGRVSNGVLHITQDRNDLNNVIGPGGIPFKPAFQLTNEFYFQALSGGRAIFNGEMTLLPRETNPVIDRILANSLVFQAFHQHFFDLNPQVWHIHLRGVGDPLALARALANVVAATGTPLPQSSPPNPTTPLNVKLLSQILGGEAEVDEDGVVVVSVPRREQIVLGGIPINPNLGVDHTINFEPLADGRTAVAPDFSLIASEINPVMSIMRKQGFTVHCLYNQETAESPQLYFSHQLAVGDAYALARAVRNGLNKTNAKFT
ncbi:DUF1259 domain-containing protein [Massilia horti]|uniref:DUF1259 domain-containing protein n=1 Tax=Massilia horti TaxID=2562153 RepID=A0A4Y9SZK9_9BURK|nr:DUF1259 domain-containing protein [Massilia horti]TFW31903.1 DUF1259 domain-containing protein [Massilia horti]